MALFSLIDTSKVELAAGCKVIKERDFSPLLEAKEILQESIQQTIRYKKEAVGEIEERGLAAEIEGYSRGLNMWTEELASIEEEITKSRRAMETAILSVAMAAAKKFVDRELKLHPETMIDIVSKSLRAVTQDKRITLFCHKDDFETLEQARPQLKKMFEHLETLTIAIKESVQPGGYIIETERGIINHSDIEKVWINLEKAFAKVLDNLGDLFQEAAVSASISSPTNSLETPEKISANESKDALPSTSIDTIDDENCSIECKN